jgi:hypothetical protein
VPLAPNHNERGSLSSSGTYTSFKCSFSPSPGPIHYCRTRGLGNNTVIDGAGSRTGTPRPSAASFPEQIPVEYDRGRRSSEWGNTSTSRSLADDSRGHFGAGNAGKQVAEGRRVLLDNRLTDGGEVVSLTLRPSFTPRKVSGAQTESTPRP